MYIYIYVRYQWEYSVLFILIYLFILNLLQAFIFALTIFNKNKDICYKNFVSYSIIIFFPKNIVFICIRVIIIMYA